MNINEFLKNYYVAYCADTLFETLYRPRIICADDFSISVQASAYHYCTPRENLITGFTKVELGFPSEPDELIFEWTEGDDYTDTVYPYVPVDVVDQLLEKHGGIKRVETSMYTSAIEARQKNRIGDVKAVYRGMEVL